MPLRTKNRELRAIDDKIARFERVRKLIVKAINGLKTDRKALELESDPAVYRAQAEIVRHKSQRERMALAREIILQTKKNDTASLDRWMDQRTRSNGHKYLRVSRVVVLPALSRSAVKMLADKVRQNISTVTYVFLKDERK